MREKKNTSSNWMENIQKKYLNKINKNINSLCEELLDLVVNQLSG